MIDALPAIKRDPVHYPMSWSHSPPFECSGQTLRCHNLLVTERWYKEAVLYCLDVETFQDSNGDGYGDLPGLSAGWTISPGSASPACG